ncbi:MAG: N-acetylglucosamine-6-phosphate deacetylase, partial [Gammaproteobacteria bacterium]|nr:N-acetylglucosamine-6-phosphate deacetylase [Gammaproteobacteria bacterium]
MPLVLTNGRVLRERGLVRGECVLIGNGRILDIVPPSDPRCRGAEPYDLGGRLLLPGFIDSQVNGGGGVLFNDAPTVESIRIIGRAHRRFGTTGFLPTLISADLDIVARAIEAVRAALAAGVPGVLGIHIEGPFLNAERKGVHDPAKLRELDPSALGLLTSLRGGRTLVTLAPEMTTPQLIERLAAAGVVVSAGHTNATYAQMREALAHGLTGFTHL